jgi:hypothetical protein
LIASVLAEEVVIDDPNDPMWTLLMLRPVDAHDPRPPEQIGCWPTSVEIQKLKDWRAIGNDLAN